MKESYQCPFEYALSIIGGKWRGLVIFYLGRNGVMRYSQLRRTLEGITQKMLTQTLRFLEAEGVSSKEPTMIGTEVLYYPTMPLISGIKECDQRPAVNE